MNRIESKIHCTHAHKKGKSKKKNGREKQMCVCVYIFLSPSDEPGYRQCVVETPRRAFVNFGEREREKERGN